ncbi:hypothetical protein MIMGU_mgv1a007928mg [Erythranthe guttata]|uniref:PGG domain-containing protein n=1 Tax=Erythranthe guttata TaxID=4155 RepID=A0A022PV93_ERYGU|nr:hypothetical protein MIMGU_mgv1a007928mg [Erythranthe guttata]
MERKSAEQRLYDAASSGDARALQELHQTDQFLLDKISYTCSNKTPLHIATTKGHLAFVREILKINPRLAEELDSQQSSALHIASARGYVEIAEELLSAAPDMCLSRDSQGRNPLHLAAMKGHDLVVTLLVEAAPVAAREKLDRGLTVLHLCVKYSQLESLKILVPIFKELLYSEDDDGNTILHMALGNKQSEIIRYLVQNTDMDVNATNYNTKTAYNNKPIKWLTKKRDSIMVVAILIATMAFQAGVSPAGGVWQEDLTQDPQGNYLSFIRANTIAFISSLSTILLLISGLPFRKKIFMWILMVIMWVTITSIAVTYAMSIAAVTPKKFGRSLSHVIEIGLAVWTAVMATLLVGNTARLADRWLKKKGVNVWRPKRFRNSVEACQENSTV